MRSPLYHVIKVTRVLATIRACDRYESMITAIDTMIEKAAEWRNVTALLIEKESRRRVKLKKLAPDIPVI